MYDTIQQELDHIIALGKKDNIILAGLTRAYAAGRHDIITEIKHGERMLLDGFGHPKDCGFCANQRKLVDDV